MKPTVGDWIMGILITIVLLVPHIARAQEEVYLPEHEKTLILPEDYETLRELYISMAGDYLQSEADLEKALVQNGKLVERLNASNDALADVEELVKSGEALVEAIENPKFRNYSFIELGMDITEDSYDPMLGMQFVFYDKFSLRFGSGMTFPAITPKFYFTVGVNVY